MTEAHGFSLYSFHFDVKRSLWILLADVVNGSDIVLEAILEAEVAHSAKDFFAQPTNQIKYDER